MRCVISPSAGLRPSGIRRSARRPAARPQPAPARRGSRGRGGRCSGAAAPLRPAFDAVYTGLHREALNRRYDWFEGTAHPNHASWRVPDGEISTWRGGVARLEHLHEHGSAPHASTVRHSFAPDGTAAVTSQSFRAGTEQRTGG
ncbi:DUF3291 domain-containing protein [Streptomyces sp. DSM 40868]|nr:DUF3291 domain-containing protein [Streptomyces sp. DSM 40868]